MVVTPAILCVRSAETKSHQKSMRFGVQMKKGNFREYGGTVGTMACGSRWVRVPIHVAGASVHCFACGGQVILQYRASTVLTWRCVSFPSLRSIASGVADASKFRNQSDRGRHLEQGRYRDLNS